MGRGTHPESVKREVARLAAMGVQQVEIARRMNVNKITVCRWLAEPRVKAWETEYHTAFKEKESIITEAQRHITVQDRIEALCHASVDLLSSALTGSDVSPSQLKAAEMILDRAGYAKKSETKVTSNVLTTDDLTELKARAAKAEAEFEAL